MSFENTLNDVLVELAKKSRQDIIDTPEDMLVKKFWYFKYDLNMNLDWNIYFFSSNLESFSHSCRIWEEHHNGTCCVVERVRDKYLLPRIREFRETSLI